MTIEDARRFREQIRALARDVIEEERPAPRTARVVSWDPATRRAMVVYLGETEPVSVPYQGVAPSAIDQEVVIGGNRHDRHVIDVKGESGTEEGFRVYRVEDALGYLDAYVTGAQSFPGDTWTGVNFAGQFSTPVGIDVLDPSTFRVAEPGMYRISTRFALKERVNMEYDVRLQKQFASNGSTKTIATGKFIFRGDDGDSENPEDYIGILPTPLETLQPFQRGDIFRVQANVPGGFFSQFTLSTRGDCSLLATRVGFVPEDI